MGSVIPISKYYYVNLRNQPVLFDTDKSPYFLEADNRDLTVHAAEFCRVQCVCVWLDTGAPPPGVSVGGLSGPPHGLLSRLTRYRNFKYMELHNHAWNQDSEIGSNYTPNKGENGGLLLQVPCQT